MYNKNLWDAYDLKFFNGPGKYTEDDACYGSLPGMIRRFKRDHEYHAKPQTLVVSFRLDPFERGVDVDDYYYDEDEDDYDVDEMVDLQYYEIVAYCKWLIKHNILPPFSIESFIETETVYLPFQYWTNINSMYFSLTMLRYMHEGQNICRRIVEFDKLFELDPFVNVAMSHWFSEGCYNGGHCVCDCSYWRMERFWDNPHGQEMKKHAQLYLARISQSMYETFASDDDDWDEYSTGDYGDNPYFSWEDTCEKAERKLRMTTPKTWRGLCRYTCK
jgi:hypothetical protein